jgi:glycosyltransferase involved in cell wall biosynthesis
MRVLVVQWGQSIAGPRFALNMARGLADGDGNEVWVSYCTESEIAPEWEERFVRERRVPTNTYRSRLGVIFGAWRLLVVTLRLRRLVRTHQIEVVYSPFFHAWFTLAGRAITGRRALLLESVHDATLHPGDESRVEDALRRRSREVADLLVTYSDDVFRKVIAQGEATDRVISLRHGVDFHNFEARNLESLASHNEYTALLVGRIRTYKGVDLFVEAIRSARESGVCVRGVVRGEGDVDPVLIQTSEDFIDWGIGWIPESDFLGIIRTADLVVLPYEEASQSGILAQAASAGTPAVVTPVGGLIEQAEQMGNALVCAEVSADAIARGIESLLASDHDYHERSQAGLVAAATTYGWAAVAGDLTSAIDQRGGSAAPNDRPIRHDSDR